MAETPTKQVIDHRPRCWRCGRVLAAWLTRPWAMRCSRCKTENAADSLGR